MAPVRLLHVALTLALVPACAFRAVSPATGDGSDVDGGPRDGLGDDVHSAHALDSPFDASGDGLPPGVDGDLVDHGESMDEHQPWVLPPGVAPGDPAIAAVADSSGWGGCISTRSGGLWCWGALLPEGDTTPEFWFPRRTEAIPPVRGFGDWRSGHTALDREGRIWNWDIYGHACGSRCQTCVSGGRVSRVLAPLPARSLTVSGWGIFEDGSCRRVPAGDALNTCTWRVDWREGVVAFAAAGTLRCAVRSSGRLECYNEAPTSSSEPRGREFPFHRFGETPTEYPGLSDVVDFAFLNRAQCTLHRSGEVRCWGESTCGEAGSSVDLEDCTDNPFEGWRCYRNPRRVPGIHDAVRLIPFPDGACVLRRDGTVWCWGWVRRGRFGVYAGQRFDNSPWREPGAECLRGPAPVEGLRDVVDLSLGAGGWCAVIRDGRVFCFGGLPGDGTGPGSGWPPREVRWE